MARDTRGRLITPVWSDFFEDQVYVRIGRGISLNSGDVRLSIGCLFLMEADVRWFKHPVKLPKLPTFFMLCNKQRQCST